MTKNSYFLYNCQYQKYIHDQLTNFYNIDQHSIQTTYNITRPQEVLSLFKLTGSNIPFNLFRTVSLPRRRICIMQSNFKRKGSKHKSEKKSKPFSTNVNIDYFMDVLSLLIQQNCIRPFKLIDCRFFYWKIKVN